MPENNQSAEAESLDITEDVRLLVHVLAAIKSDPIPVLTMDARNLVTFAIHRIMKALATKDGAKIIVSTP